ncbi:hybrid sensor histidine kinase/response regulator [Chitinimonas sp. BJYL2]|uniref:hybrid sensor histidine kinase/response regulator n=1 Tax=Chitinimonas sp. BJYL2 TaxID=2976696 RepID=UPI0022B516DD|nr:hybrid sensor histidine kinase/response regulator [Chitinimonas sp. BJYL2]
MMSRGILPRLLAAFLLLSPIPLTGLAWLFLQAYERSLQDTVLDHLSSVADKKSDQINTYLNERIADVQLLANARETHQAMQRMRELQPLGLPHPSYLAEAARFRSDMRKLLDAVSYYDLLLTDSDGNVVFSIAAEADLGSNLNSGPFHNSGLAQAHREALAVLDAQVKLVQTYTPSADRPAIFIVAPVFAADEVIGTVALQLDLENFTQVTNDSTGLGNTGETTLAFRDNQTVLFASPLQRIPDAAFKHRVSLRDVPGPMAKALSGAYGGGVVRDYSGTEVVAAWRYLPALHWGMVTKIDAAEAFAPARTVSRYLLAVLGIMLLLATLAAWRIAVALVTPIHQLTATTRRIAEGDLHDRAPLTGWAELRDLARSFNEMLERLDQQQQALDETRQQAEAASQAKSRFLATMSHELRTPLNAILGFSSLLQRETGLTPHQQEQLQVINRSGEHLLALINDVLDMAKIESGRQQLHLAAFDLPDLVADIVAMMQVRANERQLGLLAEQEGQVPRYVVGDAAKLRQILINLLGNAIKHTHEGGVALRLGLAGGNDDGKVRLRFDIEDSGIGIPEQERERIFDAFIQTDAGAQQGGTGLGLAISREFARMMAGDITVTSTPGHGSTFRVDIMVGLAQQADLPMPIGAQANQPLLAADEPPWRVLIVEDQYANQALLATLLRRAGFEVRIAADGEAGVAMFSEWQPQFIWMDRRMPRLDGLAATRRIRALPGGDQVRIVMVSASVFGEDRDEVMTAGLDDFLRKPYRADEIYTLMQQHLGIRFVYPEADIQTSKPDTTPQDLGALANLPADLQTTLRQALLSLNEDDIALAITAVARSEPLLAQRLRHFAEQLDYAAILAALPTSSLG